METEGYWGTAIGAIGSSMRGEKGSASNSGSTARQSSLLLSRLDQLLKELYDIEARFGKSIFSIVLSNPSPGICNKEVETIKDPTFVGALNERLCTFSSLNNKLWELLSALEGF